MIKPFTANFFARAISDGFFNIIALFVCVKSIKPNKNCVFVLCFKLRLTVNCPRKIPIFRAVFNGYDTAGCYFALTRVTFANIDDVLDYIFVR